jgi:cyanophycinase
MAGQIGLAGGEEFRAGCEEMDREIMLASGQSPARVIIVPTAQLTGPAKAANDGTTHFGGLGGDSSALMVLNRDDAHDPNLVEAVAGAGVIYFTGGSPDHLLSTLQDSPLLEAVLQAHAGGAVVAGSSAGAMVMGSLMRRPSSGGWVDALGVVPSVGVLPHHERRDPEETWRDLKDSAPSGLTILGVDARAGCLGNPGSWRVVGSGNVTVYRDGWRVYAPGESLPADV